MDQDVIKYRFCFLFAISIFAGFTLQAQVNNEKLKKRVTIYKDAMRVDSFLNLLSRQTGVGFSFNSKKISPTKMISMKKGSYTMADCLAHIQRNSGIHYAMMNNHIILVDNPPQEKYRLRLPAREPPVKKLVTTKAPVRPVAKPITAKAPARSIDTTSISKTDSSLTPMVKTDTTLVTTLPDSTTTITRADSLRAARAEAAKARQQAAAAAAAVEAAKEEKNEAFTATNLMAGASVLRPDIYSMTGAGITVQFERFVSNSISMTAAAGYHRIFGEYTIGTKLDTAGIPIGDSVAKNFSQLPVLLGARYYPLRPLYIAFEAGYSFKASKNVSSYLSLSPSVGVKIPVGDGNIDLTINYLYMNGKATIPEKTKLEKGNFGFWCFRVAYGFK